MIETRRECKIVSNDYINDLEHLIYMIAQSPLIKDTIVDTQLIERLENLCIKIRTDKIKIIEEI